MICTYLVPPNKNWPWPSYSTTSITDLYTDGGLWYYGVPLVRIVFGLKLIMLQRDCILLFSEFQLCNEARYPVTSADHCLMKTHTPWEFIPPPEFTIQHPWQTSTPLGPMTSSRVAYVRNHMTITPTRLSSCHATTHSAWTVLPNLYQSNRTVFVAPVVAPLHDSQEMGWVDYKLIFTLPVFRSFLKALSNLKL